MRTEDVDFSDDEIVGGRAPVRTTEETMLKTMDFLRAGPPAVFDGELGFEIRPHRFGHGCQGGLLQAQLPLDSLGVALELALERARLPGDYRGQANIRLLPKYLRLHGVPVSPRPSTRSTRL